MAAGCRTSQKRGLGGPWWGQNALSPVCTRICVLVWGLPRVLAAGYHVVGGGGLAEGHSRSCCVISYTCTRIYNFFKIKSLIKRTKPVSIYVLHKGKETPGENKSISDD